jgi:HEAT repeat protein/Zn-dependent protease with chaperone function
MNSAVVAAFLINALVQIPLIALVAWLAARMLRNAPARQQHLVWAVALVLCLALPLLSVMPRPSRPSAVAAAAPQQTASAAPSAALHVLLERTQRPAARGANLAQLLAIAYGAFVAYRALALLRGWRQTRRLVRSAGVDLSAAVRQRCAIDAPILASHAAKTPMTVGAIHPVIILPAALFGELSDDALLSLVGHEAAHIRRRDFLVNLALELVAVPIAFHPVVWLLRRRLALTRELACDEQVTPALVPPRAYARALVDIASFARGAAGPMVSLTMAGSDFEHRIRRIIRRPSMKTSRVLVAAAWVALGAAGAAAAAIAVRPNLSMDNPGAGFSRTGRAEARPHTSFSSPNAEARAAAACEAGRARDEAAIPQLLAMLGDDTPVAEVRCYEGRWSPALQSFEHPSPGEQAALALASISRPAVDPLVRALDDRSPVVRRNAAWAIGEVRGSMFVGRSDALAPLIRLLSDGDATVRRAAAFGLSELKDGDAVDPLIAALADRDEAMRGMVVVALAEIRDRRATPALAQTVITDSSAEIRRAAAWALGELKDPRAVDALNRALHDPPVRAAAEQALAEIN